MHAVIGLKRYWWSVKFNVCFVLFLSWRKYRGCYLCEPS